MVTGRSCREYFGTYRQKCQDVQLDENVCEVVSTIKIQEREWQIF